MSKDQTIEKLKESLKKNRFIYFRRKGWNEDWILTDNPIWDLNMFEYKTFEEGDDETS